MAALIGDADLGRFSEIELGQADGAELLAVAGADQVAGRLVTGTGWQMPRMARHWAWQPFPRTMAGKAE